jgi:predicted acylesterase/phospholipase RssA
MKNITHLVFAGNALRSICLCGVLRYLYCYNLDKLIHDVSATSMGALFALAFALKIPIERLENILYNMAKTEKITKFKLSNLMNIINNYGLCCSIDYLEEIRNYVREIYEQDDLTFLELSKKTGINIYISTTRVDNGSNIIFNVNDTPNISVFEAIAASMCIPLASKPIIIDGYYYVDGYLSNNLPYEIFTNNNVDKNNILAIACNVSNGYKMPAFTQGEELSIFQYYYNIALIYNTNTFKLSYLNKLNNLDNILLIDVNNIKCICNYDNVNDCIDFSLSDQDINNLCLIGFKSIHDYMNEEK